MANLWRISRDSRLSHLWNGSVPTKEGRFRLIIQCLCSLKHVGGLSSLTISGTAGRLKFDWGSWTLGAAAAGWQLRLRLGWLVFGLRGFRELKWGGEGVIVEP